MILLHLWACQAPEQPAIPVRTGWVADSGERLLANGRYLRGLGGEHPQIAECVELAAVDLGDVRGLVAAGIPAPDTALAWSPDGDWLAVGSYLGELVVIDGWTGEVRARRTLTESSVRAVAWSPDGKTLYAAEQSMEGTLRAVDPATLEDRAVFALADRLERSAPPAADDLYGLYTLPGTYALEVLPGGDLIVVGAHGWNAPERRNRSQVLRLTPELKERARWPTEPADATFLAATVSADGVAVAVSRSSTGPAPEGIGVGGVAVLDLDLKLKSTAVPPPLPPHHTRAWVWQAIGLQTGRLTLGLGDGRVWREDRVRALGTPLEVGSVPIAATIGTLVDTGEMVYTATSGTSIPYGAARPDVTPPEAHPAENTLFALDPQTLETRWSWHGTEGVQGLSVQGRWLSLGVSGPGRHGVLVFDLTRVGAGTERLAASCSTPGPVFWRSALSADGRVAVASFPEKKGASVDGAYRVHLFL